MSVLACCFIHGILADEKMEIFLEVPERGAREGGKITLTCYAHALDPSGNGPHKNYEIKLALYGK